MDLDKRQKFYVAVKIFLRDGDKLLIIKDKFDDGWDLPGGRILKSEKNTPLSEVIKRKVTEELGENVEFKLNDIKVTFQHRRVEQGESGKPTIDIFAIGYAANYIGGEIKLGEYLDEFKWVCVNNFEPNEYFVGGWCKGIEDYLQNIK